MVHTADQLCNVLSIDQEQMQYTNLQKQLVTKYCPSLASLGSNYQLHYSMQIESKMLYDTAEKTARVNADKHAYGQRNKSSRHSSKN